MEKEKKKWENPKLICLYRGRPEEAVLAGCKGGVGDGPVADGPPKCKDNVSKLVCSLVTDT